MSASASILRALLAVLLAVFPLLPVAADGTESEHPPRPYLPLRLMDLSTYGTTITHWLEPGTVNFAQINWVNANLCRYDFRPEAKPPDFTAQVAAAQARLKAKADLAHRLGLLAYLNEYEVNYPDFIARESLLPSEARRQFMEAKIYEIFTQCPWLDGYMITPTESKLGAANPTELRAVVLGAYAGMKRAEQKLGKKRYLFVRSWLSSSANLARVKEYFPITTDPEIAKDIIVVAKDGLGDFVMHRPLNPLFGACQPHPVCAEFDVSVSEYRSLGWYPQGPATLWNTRMQQLVSTPGVIGINIHTGRLTDVPGLTPEQLFPRFKEDRIVYPFAGGVKWSPWHHLNIYTLYRLLRNPWESPRKIYEDWARENYGEKAAKPLADILLLSDDALYHAMLTFGVNLNNHSSFSIGGEGAALIENIGKSIQYQMKLQPYLSPLFEINSDTADRALAEKELALKLTDTMLSILDDHRQDFAASDYAALREDLLRMRGAVKGYTFSQAGYFAYEVAVAEPPVPHRAYYVQRVKEMIAEAEKLAVSQPNFLHQQGNHSFLPITRAFEAGLKAKGLWDSAADQPTPSGPGSDRTKGLKTARLNAEGLRPASAERPGTPTLWEQAQPVRPGAGGLEAERDTWVRTPKRFERIVTEGREAWPLRVAGDARPTMRHLTLECLDGPAESPFLLSDKNYDFRSVPELVASVTKDAKTPEEKALALRELLIGEGFFFHFPPPPSSDPIHRLTNCGYGYCGVHAQIYDQLCQAAGLRSRLVSHPFASGHATNEVYYNGQWHFIDTDAEAFFRRPDGVIPSYADIHKNPGLIPAGDAYGQTSFGIDGARFIRALYTAKLQTYERPISADTHYGTLDFPLRPGESITWDWQDADFTHNRNTAGKPVYGTGRLEYHPPLRDLAGMGHDVREESSRLTLADGAAHGTVRIPVVCAYPIQEVQAAAQTRGSADGIAVRISKDAGKTWRELQPTSDAGRTLWQTRIEAPDAWADATDQAAYTDTSRTLQAGHYGYLLEIALTRIDGKAPALSGFQLVSLFRHYPPALPYLKRGENLLTYVDRGTHRRVRVTLEWEERTRAPGLSTRASDWGRQEPVALTPATALAALPTLATGPRGVLHLVYSVGAPGTRRVAYRRYEDGRWSAQRLVTPPGQDANHPVVAEDGRGTVWIAYQTGGLWKGGDVFVLSLDSAGGSEPVRLNADDPYHIAFFPSITAHDRRVTVAWEGGQPDVDARTAWGVEVGWMRTYDGDAWTAPVLLKGKPFANLGLPKICYDRAGRLHLTATKGPRYYTTLPLGDRSYEWLTPEWLYHSRGGALHEDAQGNLWAVFDGQNSGTTNEIYCRMLPAEAAGTEARYWTPALRVSEDDKRPSLYPDLVADGPQRVAVVWMDYRHESAEVYGKLFADGRWSPDLLLSHGADASARARSPKETPNRILTETPQGLQSEYPHIARAGDGTLWVVWADTTGSTRARIMACRLDWNHAMTASAR